MKNLQRMTRLPMWLSALLMVLFVTGCGGGGGRDPILGINATPPTVASTVAANNATAVGINQAITATFSTAMNPSTLTKSSFTVTGPDSVAISGNVTYSGTTATFTPDVALPQSTLLTARIFSSVTDVGGSRLSGNVGVFPALSDYVWSFTTADVTAPTVTSTISASGASGVATNIKIVAFFSEAMNPATINAANFTVTDGLNSVPGTISYSGVSAVFSPTSQLAFNTTYKMTISSNVTDLAGNKLSGNQAVFPASGNYVWSFTTGSGSDTTPPTISSTINADGATGVAANTKIGAFFSEAMDPATLNATSFTVRNGATLVAGTISYSGVAVTFSPNSVLLPNTKYSMMISSAATDTSGNKLFGNQGPTPSDYLWSFTTGATTDNTRPTVVTTSPSDTETNVSATTSVNASFSKAMLPSTISTATFSLKKAGVAVSGTVTYQGMTATFQPASNLDLNTSYTATIRKNVTDIAGNTLAGNQGAAPSDYVWTFTTGAAVPPPVSAGPGAVNLRSAAAFAVLSGSGVTSTGATIINGDLGTSPTGTINGFPPGIVNGTIHAADPIAAQAKLDLTTAYNDAQGRSLNAISLPGDLGGLTLAPGLYVNSSSTGISGSGVLTLDAQGNPNATWIFKMGSTLTTGTGSQIVLAGGASASNIVWAVGTSATLGVTSIFKGNILADQSISLATGAVSNGRMLARIGAVTLQGNTVTLP